MITKFALTIAVLATWALAFLEALAQFGDGPALLVAGSAAVLLHYFYRRWHAAQHRRTTNDA